MLLSKLNQHSSPNTGTVHNTRERSYNGLEVHMKNAIIANIHDI
jgi:hypothetical protein